MLSCLSSVLRVSLAWPAACLLMLVAAPAANAQGGGPAPVPTRLILTLDPDTVRVSEGTTTVRLNWALVAGSADAVLENNQMGTITIDGEPLGNIYFIPYEGLGFDVRPVYPFDFEIPADTSRGYQEFTFMPSARRYSDGIASSAEVSVRFVPPTAGSELPSALQNPTSVILAIDDDENLPSNVQLEVSPHTLRETDGPTKITLFAYLFSAGKNPLNARLDIRMDLMVQAENIAQKDAYRITTKNSDGNCTGTKERNLEEDPLSITIPTGDQSGMVEFCIDPVDNMVATFDASVLSIGPPSDFSMPSSIDTIGPARITIPDNDAAPSIIELRLRRPGENLNTARRRTWSVDERRYITTPYILSAHFVDGGDAVLAKSVTLGVHLSSTADTTATQACGTLTIPAGTRAGSQSSHCSFPVRDTYGTIAGHIVEVYDVHAEDLIRGDYTIRSAFITLRDVANDEILLTGIVEGNEVRESVGVARLKIRAKFKDAEKSVLTSTLSVKVGFRDITTDGVDDYAVTLPDNEGDCPENPTGTPTVSKLGIAIRPGDIQGETTFCFRPVNDTLVEGDESLDIVFIVRAAGDVMTTIVTDVGSFSSSFNLRSTIRLTILDDTLPTSLGLELEPPVVRVSEGETTVRLNWELPTGSAVLGSNWVGTITIDGEPLSNATPHQGLGFDITSVHPLGLEIPAGQRGGYGEFTFTPSTRRYSDGVASSAEVSVRFAPLTPDSELPAVLRSPAHVDLTIDNDQNLPNRVSLRVSSHDNYSNALKETDGPSKVTLNAQLLYYPPNSPYSSSDIDPLDFSLHIPLSFSISRARTFSHPSNTDGSYRITTKNVAGHCTNTPRPDGAPPIEVTIPAGSLRGRVEFCIDPEDNAVASSGHVYLLIHADSGFNQPPITAIFGESIKIEDDEPTSIGIELVPINFDGLLKSVPENHSLGGRTIAVMGTYTVHVTGASIPHAVEVRLDFSDLDAVGAVFVKESSRGCSKRPPGVSPPLSIAIRPYAGGSRGRYSFCLWLRDDSVFNGDRTVSIDGVAIVAPPGSGTYPVTPHTFTITDDETPPTAVDLSVFYSGHPDALQESDPPTEVTLTASFNGEGTLPDIRVPIPLVFSGAEGTYDIRAGDCITTPGPEDTPPPEIIIPAGESSSAARFCIAPIDIPGVNEDRVLTIDAPADFSVPPITTVNHTVIVIEDDNSSPTGIRYRVDDQDWVSVGEGDRPAEIRVTAEFLCGGAACGAGASAFPFDVTLPVQGYSPPRDYERPAAGASDYSSSPRELPVVIRADSHSRPVSMSFTPVDDGIVEDDEAVAYAAYSGGDLHLGADGTIVPAVDAVYTLEQQPAYVVIRDNDAPTITLTVSPGAVDEGGREAITLDAAFPPGTRFELQDDVALDIQVRSPLNPRPDASRGLAYALDAGGLEDWALGCGAVETIADDAEQIVRIRTPLTLSTRRGDGSGSLTGLCFEALADLLHEGNENVVFSAFSGGDPLREDDRDRSGRFIVTPEVLTIRDADAGLPGPIALSVHAPAGAIVNEGGTAGVPVRLEARLPEGGAVLSGDLELTVTLRQGNAHIGEARYRDDAYTGRLRPDYERVAEAPLRIVIPAGHRGARSSEFTLTPIDDNVVERDKTIPVTGRVETAAYAGISVTGTALTLEDDDRESPGGVVLTVDRAAIPEGDADPEQTTTVTVTARLTGGLRYSQDLVVQPRVLNDAGEALGRSSEDPRVSTRTGRRWHFDEVNNGKPFTFTVSVTPRPDNIVEEDVPLTITARVCIIFSCFSGRPGYMTADLEVTPATVTIEDDDEALVSLAGPAVPVEEGTAAEFTVRLSAPVAGPVDVAWSTVDGSAVAAGADGDYEAERAGGVELSAAPPGLAVGSLSVLTRVDLLSENEEYFEVSLGAVTSAYGGRVRVDDAGTARATISANGPIMLVLEGPPQGVPEGQEAVFRVSLLPEGILPGAPITLDYATQDGTAAAGRDYSGKSGTLRFTAADALPKEVRVSTVDNSLYDGAGERSFTLHLDKVTGGSEQRPLTVLPPSTEGGGHAVHAVIVDDETPPELHLRVAPGELREEDAGTASGLARLGVEVRGSAFVEARTIAFTFGGDALLGEDYRVSSAAIVIPAGALGASNTAQVEVLDDEIDDDDEWILISARVLEEEIEVLGNAQQILIHDDDDPWVTVSFAEAFVEVPEGRSHTITALLDVPPEREVVIPLTVERVGGAGREDYADLPTELVFGPETREQHFALRVLRDRVKQEEGEGVQIDIALPLPERVRLGEPPGISVSFLGSPFGEDVQHALKYALASFGRSVAMSTLDVIEDRFEVTEDTLGASYIAVSGRRVPLGAMRRGPRERSAKRSSKPTLRDVTDVLGVRFPRRNDGSGFDSLSSTSDGAGSSLSAPGGWPGDTGGGYDSSLSAPGSIDGGYGGGPGPFSSSASGSWSGSGGASSSASGGGGDYGGKGGSSSSASGLWSGGGGGYGGNGSSSSFASGLWSGGGGGYGGNGSSSSFASGLWSGGGGGYGGKGSSSSFASGGWSGGDGANFAGASSASTSSSGRNRDSRNIGRGAGEPDMRVRIEPPDARTLLSRSEFRLAPGAVGVVAVDSAWTVWGRSDVRSFDGNPGGRFELDATTFSTHIGVDYRRAENILTGFSLSHTVGDMSYVDASRDDTRGDFRAHLTALNHYSHWSYSDHLDLYVVMGEGFGVAEIKEYGKRAKTDINLHSSILGARHALPPAGVVAMAAKADAFLVEVESDARPAIGLPKLKVQVMRMRAMLEGSVKSTTKRGARLRNTFEMGVLLDAGDADRGEGLEFGTDFHYADDISGVELSGRWMLAYASGGYQEWGAAVTLNLDPGAPGRGVRLSLAPDWGAPASGGVDALWRGASTRDAAYLRTSGADPGGPGPGSEFGHGPGGGREHEYGRDRAGGRRSRGASPEQVKMELAYGMGLQGGIGGRVEPFGTWFFEDSGAWNLRLGVRLELSRFARSETGEGAWPLNSLQMEFFNERHTALYREDDHRIGIKLSAGF